MPSLHLKLVIDLEEVGYLTFNRWLPHEPSERIRFSGKGFQAELSFSLDLMPTLFPPGISITNLVNVMARKALVEVELIDLSEELVEFSRIDSMQRIRPENKGLHDDLISKFNEVRDAIVEILNRLISCARAMKGQYWVTEIADINGGVANFYNRVEIWISYDGMRFELFRLGNPIELAGAWGENQRYISRKDWPKILEFVAGNARPPLVGSLLANAYELSSKGYRRSALLEATTALEVSLAQFIRQSKDRPLPGNLDGRLEVDTIDDLTKKFGLRGAFGLVLPLLLSEKDLPTASLSRCREAIDERNRVVHNGKRDVSRRKLAEWLPSIEFCCQALCEPNGWGLKSDQLA